MNRHPPVQKLNPRNIFQRYHRLANVSHLKKLWPQHKSRTHTRQTGQGEDEQRTYANDSSQIDGLTLHILNKKKNRKSKARQHPYSTDCKE